MIVSFQTTYFQFCVNYCHLTLSSVSGSDSKVNLRYQDQVFSMVTVHDRSTKFDMYAFLCSIYQDGGLFLNIKLNSRSTIYDMKDGCEKYYVCHTCLITLTLFFNIQCCYSTILRIWICCKWYHWEGLIWLYVIFCL